MKIFEKNESFNEKTIFLKKINIWHFPRYQFADPPPPPKILVHSKIAILNGSEPSSARFLRLTVPSTKLE